MKTRNIYARSLRERQYRPKVIPDKREQARHDESQREIGMSLKEIARSNVQDAKFLEAMKDADEYLLHDTNPYDTLSEY